MNVNIYLKTKIRLLLIAFALFAVSFNGYSQCETSSDSEFSLYSPNPTSGYWTTTSADIIFTDSTDPNAIVEYTGSPEPIQIDFSWIDDNTANYFSMCVEFYSSEASCMEVFETSTYVEAYNNLDYDPGTWSVIQGVATIIDPTYYFTEVIGLEQNMEGEQILLVWDDIDLDEDETVCLIYMGGSGPGPIDPMTICEDSYELWASTESGYWEQTQGSASIEDISSSWTMATNILEGTHTFVWHSDEGAMFDETITINKIAGITGYSVNITPTANDKEYNFEVTDIDIGTHTIYWDFGDMIGYKEGNNITYTYDTDGVYEVWVTIENTETWCWVDDIQQITVGNVACYADFEYDFETGEVINISQGVDTTNVNWYWTFGNGQFSYAGEPTISTLSLSGDLEVCLQMNDPIEGCADEYCEWIWFDGGSGSGIPSECKTDFKFTIDKATKKVSFEAETSPDIDDFYWEFGDWYGYDTIKSPTYTYEISDQYEVCLYTSSSTSGCFGSKCKTVSVIEEGEETCFADFSYYVDPTTKEVSLTNNSTGNYNNIYWTFGDGGYSVEASPTYTFANQGMNDICIEIEGANCFDSKCEFITVGTSECSLIADFKIFVDKLTVSCTDKSLGTPTSWFWDYGDGWTSEAQNPQYTFTDAGVYWIGLSVYNDATGCYDYAYEMVQVGEVNCRAKFEANVNVDTKTVTFNNLSKGENLQYYWWFGDWNDSEEKDPTNTYEEEGLYYTFLSIANDDWTCMDFYELPVQVGQITCSADFEANMADKATNKMQFKNKAKGASVIYWWEFGDGGFSEEENPSHTYDSPGYYTVFLSTFNETNWCMDWREKRILVGEEGTDCEADFIYTVNNTTKTIAFTNKSVGKNLKYNWDFGDETFGTDKSPNHTYSKGGVYNVCLTVTTDGDIDNTTCEWIAVEDGVTANCLAKFTYTPSGTNSVSFKDKSLGKPDSWLWDFGDGNTSTAQNPKHTYETNDYQEVTLTIQNSTEECKSFTLDIVNTSDSTNYKAGFGFQYDSTEARKAGGHPTDFVGAAFGDPARVEWDYGDGQTQSGTTTPTHNYSKPGTYNVCYTVSDPVTGKSSKVCKIVNVGGTTSVQDVDRLSNMLSIYPNPASDIVNIKYEASIAGKVELSILNPLGQKVKTIEHKQIGIGKYTKDFSVTNLKSGVYIIQMQSPEGIFHENLIVK